MTSGDSTAEATPASLKRHLSYELPSAKSRFSERHVTDTVLMVRPCCFGFNEETAGSNKFQFKVEGDNQRAAQTEFDAYVKALEAEGVNVMVVQDTETPPTPDSIFPNNWFSTDTDGTVCLFPMYTPNRRAERDKNVLQFLRKHFQVRRIIDFSPGEDFDQILEGTGSLILDKKHQIVYAALGPRTSEAAVKRFAETLNYAKVVTFTAEDRDGHPVYHTNVLMTLGEEFAIVAWDVIKEGAEELRKSLLETNKTIISISEDQMTNFAGNCLQLRNKENKSLIVISARAKEQLNKEQIQELETHGKLISVAIPTIETVGGGSARCMLAEVFLNTK